MGDTLATFLTILTACAGLGAIADQMVGARKGVSEQKGNQYAPQTLNEFLQQLCLSIESFLSGKKHVAVFKLFLISIVLFLSVYVLQSRGIINAVSDFTTRDSSLVSILLIAVLCCLCTTITIYQTKIFLNFAANSKDALSTFSAILADIFIAAHLFSLVAAAFLYSAGVVSTYFLPSQFNNLPQPKEIQFEISKQPSYQEYFRYSVVGETLIDKGNYANRPFIQIEFLSRETSPSFYGLSPDMLNFVDRTPHKTEFSHNNISSLDQFSDVDTVSAILTFAMDESDLLSHEFLVFSEAYAEIDSIRDRMLQQVLEKPNWKAILALSGASKASRYGNYFNEIGCISNLTAPTFYVKQFVTVDRAEDLCEDELVIAMNGVIQNAAQRRAFWNNFLINDVPISTIFTTTIFISLIFYFFVLLYYTSSMLFFVVRNNASVVRAFNKMPGTCTGCLLGLVLGMTVFL